MLPPVQIRATARPANRPRSASTAASGAAPAGSTRLRVFSIINRVASASASSETRTKSSSDARRIRCGSSNAVRVASPSANVLVVSATSEPARQERYAAGAASDCTPITSIDGRTALATTQAAAAPLPPPTGTTITSTSGRASISSRVQVATPETRAGSFPEWMYRYRCSAACFSQNSRASSKSRPWKTTSAPRARIDSTFTGLARSGMQITARTPNRSAA
jgi:hypothetical protein